jgi:hypothetical protein
VPPCPTGTIVGHHGGAGHCNAKGCHPQVAAAITTLLFQPVLHQLDDQAAGQRVCWAKLAIHLIEKEIVGEF